MRALRKLGELTRKIKKGPANQYGPALSDAGQSKSGAGHLFKKVILKRAARGRFCARLYHVTKVLTKRAPKKHRCEWCRENFRPSGRGRPPRFCAQSCRQRAYERRLAQHPLQLLKHDLAAAKGTEHVRQIVVDVLVELGLIDPPPKVPKRGRRSLRVV